jgi:hypothetical protein
MTHRFTFPHVVEIGPDAARTVRPVGPRPSQRSLVEPALLRRPARDGRS